MWLMRLTTKVPQVPHYHQWTKQQGPHCHTLHTRSLWKCQKDLWYIWHPNRLLRWQHHQEPPGLPQGQRPYGQPKWCHILVSMWDLSFDDECIGETFRTFAERYKEHLKDPSPIHQHNNQTSHPINHTNFQIIWREGHHLSRYIKESIFIRVNNCTLNNNVGKFNLPHIWDRILINTHGLKLKR